MKKETLTGFRFILFILITAFIFLGPFYRQVLNGKNILFRNWVMWSGQGVGIYDVRFYLIKNHGNREFINFKTLLKKTGSEARYRELKKVRTKLEILTLAKIVCDEYNGHHLSMELRKGTRDGWKNIYGNKSNICNRGGRLNF